MEHSTGHKPGKGAGHFEGTSHLPASKRNRYPEVLGGSHVGQHPRTRKSDYPVVGGVTVNVPYVHPCKPIDNTPAKARNPGTQPAPSYKPGNPDMIGGY